MTRLHHVAPTVALLALAGAAHALPILYVDQDRPLGNGPGGSWNTAFTNLQDALAVAANPANGVREIRVAEGVYTPDRGGGHTTGDRDASFVLVSQLIITGGYAGLGHPDPNLRDPALHPTILSGDLDANDGPDFANTLDNSHQVVRAAGLLRAPTLDGLTIAAGNKFGSTTPDGFKGAGLQVLGCDIVVRQCEFIANRGGALYIESDTLTLSDSVFTDNTGGIEAIEATISVTGTDFFCHSSPAILGDNATLTIDDCLFSDNRNQAVSLFYCSATVTDSTFDGNVTNGLDGAGLWADGVGGNTIDIIDSLFTGNIALNGRGGGVYINGGNPHSLVRCDFVDNVADAGGGAYFPRGEVIDCTFTGNAAIAVSLGDGGGLVSDKNTVTRCEFRGNTATGRGGGAFSSDGTGNFGVYYNCVFAGNESTTDSGGGVWANATRMMNCLIIGNTARFGGGGMVINNTSEIRNCTVVGNNSVLEEFNGALIDGNCTVVNCIFWDNNGAHWSNNNNLNNSLTSFSLVQGIDFEFLGAGNTSDDPLFIDADGPDDIYGTLDDDCRVLAGSPAIDAGDNGAVPADDGDVDDDGNTAETTPIDLLGNARFIDDPASADSGAGTAPLIDMGAFEFVPGAASPPCAGDVNGDDAVDFADLNLVLAAWGSVDDSLDLDDSGLVDFGDLNEVLARWGEVCSPPAG